MSAIRVGVNGAAGRMGQRLVDLIHQDADLELAAALDWSGHPKIGQDAGELAGIGAIGVKLSSELDQNTQLNVMIDFSLPEGTMSILPVCVARHIPLVLATTGHTSEQLKEIEETAHDTALLMAPNMSLSVNVLFELVRRTSEMLTDKDFDVEIIERHHRFKKDAPSGTALHFAKVIQDVMKQSEIRHGREGVIGERPRQEIGMHALRVGDNVGEHTVVFSTLGETLELVHRGHTRDSYARGALEAAKFLADRPAGRYSMNDVLGL